jgi:hypothetical protein
MCSAAHNGGLEWVFLGKLNLKLESTLFVWTFVLQGSFEYVATMVDMGDILGLL